MTLPDDLPDIQFDLLRLWVHEQPFPAGDSWDAAWLSITAHCAEDGACVTLVGPYLQTDDVLRWVRELRAVYDTLAGTATLRSYEPNLRVTVNAVGPKGGISVEVCITPNHLTQAHSFRFEVDQTYLPPLITACERILAQYPVLAAGSS